MLANHSISGGTSARSKNSFALSARAWVGMRALSCFFLGVMGELGSGVDEGVVGLTQTGMLWANITVKNASGVKRDKTPYHVTGCKF
jgi:hypothetical protein